MFLEYGLEVPFCLPVQNLLQLLHIIVYSFFVELIEAFDAVTYCIVFTYCLV